MARTHRLQLDPDALDTPESRARMDHAAALWRAGGTVAFPTETVYGLGANALDAAAVEKIFRAKRRPAWDPLIVHVADPAALSTVAARVPARAQALIDAFWPGPLTLLLPRAAAIPDVVTAGRPLVGTRMPAHPVARALLAAAALPIAAPSANSFGRPSPTTAAHVLEDLDGRIDAVVDAGPASHGLESTVVDASDSPLVVYRPGVVTLEDLRRVAGPVVLYAPPSSIDAATPDALPSPGVGIRHYAPRAKLILLDEPALSGAVAALCETARGIERQGGRPGIMLPGGGKDFPAEPFLIFPWGDWQDSAALARRLFLGLRDLDARGATHILCPLPPEDGLGLAMRDRLRKAARPA